MPAGRWSRDAPVPCCSQPVLAPVLDTAVLGGMAAKVLVRSGVVRPLLPSQLITLGRVLAAWGTGPAGGFHAAAVLDPDREGIVDELGAITFGEMHRRSNALARALAERGVGEGDSVALMCRNHRGSSTRRSARPSSAPTCSTSTPRSPGPSWPM